MKLISLAGPVQATLAERFRNGDPDVCALFGFHPSREEDWWRRAAFLDDTAARRADRKRLAAAIRAGYARLAAGPAAEAALRKLERPDSLVVVGGQQAGLFGGPLLVLYKALAVVRTAARAERLLNRPVVPVFWIAGEDHDFAEANETHVLAPDGEVRKIRLEGIAAGRHAVSRTPVPEAAWNEAIERLARALPDSTHKPELLRGLRETVADAPTLTVAFARLLARWFGDEGLLLMDADDPGVRRVEGPFFRELIERNEELSVALAAGEARVRALGFEPQVDVTPDGANLFVHHELGRLLLYRRDGRFTDRRGLFRADREDLVRLAEDEPERLSNGVLSRPLMQEYVLPVLATVLGPAEIAYWGLLGPAFERFGMAMPVIVPRPSFTFLDPQTASLLERYSLAPEEAIWHWEERRNAWLAGLGAWRWEERFRRVREGVAALYDPLLEALVAEEPGLRDLGRTNRERILGEIDYLERKAKALFLSRHDAALRQWDRIRAALQPLGRPQERVLGPVHYLNGLGPSWLRAWLDTDIDADGGHRLAWYEQTVREACRLECKA